MAKILVVDDENIILKAYVRELREAGYDAVGIQGPEEAVTLIKKESVDIVLLDLVLAETTGVLVCRLIKEISPDVHVVLMSGFPEETEKYQMDFIAAGGLDFWLRKPLLNNELVEVVKKLRSKKKGGPK